MIQHKEIIGLMEGKVPFSKKTQSDLSELINEYPYFQAAHLLHTLNLLHLQDSDFLTDLRNTAIYVQDRRQLFFRIEGGFFEPKQIDTLERETPQFGSSFDIIDNFLSESGEITDFEKNEIQTIQVPVDYVSYILSDNEENQEAPPLQYQDTIDKFLEQDAISPMRIKLDKADKQEVELPDPPSEQPIGDNFFSETLAKIYVKQKKYTKAMEIIHQLNLIYPEKNRYFADQIRFLEKLIINTNKNK